MKVIDKEVDIRSYPAPIIPLPEQGVVDLFVGDLHANPVKLINFLTRHQVMILSPKDYAELIKHYHVLATIDRKTSTFSINSARIGFLGVLERATFNRGARVIIGGDETQDRGIDYFVFEVYRKLIEAGITVKTLWSNHGHEFIRSYENFRSNRQNGLLPLLMRGPHVRSTIVTQMMINKNCITEHELCALVESFYKPTLCVFNYSLDRSSQTIVFNKHAPANLEVIYHAQVKFGIVPLLNLQDPQLSVDHIAAAIDAVNEVFMQCVQTNQVSRLTDHYVLQAGYEGKPIDVVQYPFEYILWNRNCDIDRPLRVGQANVVYVHGHHEEDSLADQTNIINLDSTFGKSFMEPNFKGRFLSLMFKPQHQGVGGQEPNPSVVEKIEQKSAL